jgi:hypothetical protein
MGRSGPPSLRLSGRKKRRKGEDHGTNFVLQEWGSGLADLIPHIESALGRKLTEGELAEGRISHV